jgi:hypothetical protein
MVTLFGQKIKTEKKLTAPNNKVVLDYLKAAKKGESLVKKILKGNNK